MSAPETATPQPNRRGLLIAIVVVVVLALAGGSYYGYRAYSATKPGNIDTPSPLGDIALGPGDARVTIIEYASMTCPHCAAFTKETFPKLKTAYIDSGKARYVFREFPLDQLALLGAQLARCVAKDDGPKFFNAIEVLFATQDEWVNNKPLEPLKRLTKQLGMNDQDFDACATNETIAKGIIATRDYAYDRLKVNATPSFFINGKLLQGEASLEEFAKIIDPILAPAGAKSQ